MSMMVSKPMRRVVGGIALLLVFFVLTIHLRYDNKKEWYPGWVDTLETWTAELPAENYTQAVTSSSVSELPISYNLLVPPKIGCEAVVNDLQLRLVQAYSELLEGIRYVNLWGYLETENKGDAAIWTGQQILLSMMGIETMRVCRFMNRGCDVDLFNSSLHLHDPHSAIIMAGGGNFNDFYWQDQPSRMAMIEAFPDVPIRAFPQSVHMTHADRIQETKDIFGSHPNLQLAARDQPSFDWLDKNLGRKTLGEDKEVKSVLVPDIAFMWGNRPDFRLKAEKIYDIIIISRKDREISAGGSFDLPYGTGTVDVGGNIGNVTYYRVDWSNTHTPGIDTDPHAPRKPQAEHQQTSTPESRVNSQNLTVPSVKSLKSRNRRSFSTPEKTEFAETREQGHDQRAWAKATAGFELLASGRFVITDRLHAHIMSTVIGLPHVLMDSKLGKNLNFHDTWTQDCECTRVATNFESSLNVARMYFESERETV